MAIFQRRALLPLAAALLASMLLAPGAAAAPMVPGDYAGRLTEASVATGGLLPQIAFTLAASAPYTVPASGPVTWSIPSVSFPTDLPVTGLPDGATGTLSPKFDGPLSVSLDPKTGAATATVTGSLDLTIGYFAITTTCHVGSAVSPLTVRLSTAKSGGSPYAEGTGAITLADDAIAIPAAVCDPSAASGAVEGLLNTYLGLPTSAGRLALTGVLTLVRATPPPADTTPPPTDTTTHATTTIATVAPPLAASPPATKPKAAARCVVPRLKNRTLKAASKALKKAHCRVGKVTKRKAPRHRGRVLAQTRKSGLKLPDGTRVGLKVGRR
jgi:hypothetical protein